MAPRPVKKPARFTRLNWVDLGLSAAAQESPEAMTLEAICATAGKTRGSFYHHFPTHGDFLIAVAERWLERDTDAVIAATGPQDDRHDLGGDLGSNLRALNNVTAQLDNRLERGMRQLAAAYPAVAPHVEKADTRRKAFIRELYVSSGQADRETAERLATLIYAAYVGFAFTEPNASPERREDLFSLLPPGPM